MSRRGAELVPTLVAATIAVAVLGLVVGNQRTLTTLHDGATPGANMVPVERTALPTASGEGPGGGAVVPTNRPAIKQMLVQAARARGLNAGLVMALAWWESGWDQSAVSSTGAVGIMQVEPYTADRAGPRLLGRPVDIHQPAANIELGTAILKDNLSVYHGDIAKALAAYYAGPTVVDDWGHLDPDVTRYVLGIYRLALAFDRGSGPA